MGHYCFNTMKKIHIGHLIQEKFEERRQCDKTLTKASFARQINIHRSTLYLLFNQKSVDIELLIRISKVLNYNFIENVYFNKKNSNKKNRIFVGIEVDADLLQNINLPEEYLRLTYYVQNQ